MQIATRPNLLRRVKTTTNTIYMQQIEYANTVQTLSCMSNDLANLWLYHLHSLLPVDKCHMKFVTIHQNPMNTVLYTSYVAICQQFDDNISAADNS